MNATVVPPDSGHWLTTTDRMGGLAYGIGVSIGILMLITTINLTSYSKPYLRFSHDHSKDKTRNGPLLVVASGSDTISVASSIRRLAMENVFVVQLQHPRSRLERFDLVITPLHDYYPLTPEGKRQIPFFLRPWVTPREPPGKNVFLTTRALHNVDASTLRNATLELKDEFASLPKPLVVVNIIGPTRNCLYGVALATQLCGMLKTILWSCGSLRISFSKKNT